MDHVFFLESHRASLRDFDIDHCRSMSIFSVHRTYDDVYLEIKYQTSPDTCDLSDFIVAANALSGRNSRSCCPLLGKRAWCRCRRQVPSHSLWNHKLRKSDQPPLRRPLSHHRHSDQFLHLHFQCYIAASACGDVGDDYYEQEIGDFMEEPGVYNGEMDTTDSMEKCWLLVSILTSLGQNGRICWWSRWRSGILNALGSWKTADSW